jgi:cytochrome P450
VFSRYAHVKEIMQKWDLFSSVDMGVPKVELDYPLMPSFFDPPYQTKLRSVILPLMTAARMDQLEPQMHKVCQELIAGFRDSGRCDMVADFARRYPIAIFGDLFGLPPERREEFRILAETFLHDTEAQAAAWNSIRDIIRDELEQRRQFPRDDMLNGVAHGKIDGKVIDPDVAINLASTVFLGGLDTLPSNIGWAFRYLADNPEARHQLVEDPSLASAAAEEFLRVFPSVPKTVRVVTEDTHFHGVDLRAGDPVVGLTTAAHQDSAHFDTPLSIRFDRKVNRHMAFSVGAHRCLGSHLARHELEVALQEWHAAIPDYHVAPNTKFTYHGSAVFAIENLPLEWDV